MRFVVHALDKFDALPRRQLVIEAHCRCLNAAAESHGVQILLSGPLTLDDGETMCGSFFLLEAPSRAEVEALFAEDPLSAADVWQSRTVTAVNVRQNRMGS